MLARVAIAFAALMVMGTCNRINPDYEGPSGETWDGSDQTTSAASGSGSTSTSNFSGDGGGTGGTGGGSSAGDDGGSSETGASSDTSDTTSGGSAQDLAPDQDAWLRQQFPDEGHGQDQDLRAGSGSTTSRANRLLVRFDMSPLEPDCNFTEATLRLYYFADGEPLWANVDVILGAHPVTQSWTEAGATWNTCNGSDPWTTAGGDYDPAVKYERAIVGGQYGWVSWDVTDTAIGWCQGTLANHGLILRETPDGGGGRGRKLFHSRECTVDPDLRPVLRVQ